MRDWLAELIVPLYMQRGCVISRETMGMATWWSCTLLHDSMMVGGSIRLNWTMDSHGDL